jgi:hypothetical protein
MIGALLVGFAALQAGHARSEEVVRPPVGGIGSLPDAMVFYVARSSVGACGQTCSEWIAAEGTVQWDTYKRLIAILDRLSGRKLPVILRVWGEGNLNVAMALGKIIRERGLDVSVGSTLIDKGICATEAACFELKRHGGPLEAKLDTSDARCDVACVLILAGGVHRSLPATAKVVLGGMRIRNRLGLNISDERREGLATLFSDQFRLYLTQMGVNVELLNVIEQNSGKTRATELPADNWTKLGIVNVPAL